MSRLAYNRRHERETAIPTCEDDMDNTKNNPPRQPETLGDLEKATVIDEKAAQAVKGGSTGTPSATAWKTVELNVRKIGPGLDGF